MKSLHKGDTIGVFGPGSAANPDQFKKGLLELESRGFKYKLSHDPTLNYAKYEQGFSSDTLEKRVKAFEDLLKDEEISVIIASRGGYGSLAILPSLDQSLLEKTNKTLIGYSDVTSLLVPLADKTDLTAIHGATIAKEFAESEESVEAKESVDALIALLSGSTSLFDCPVTKVLKKGTCQGAIQAGNLTCLMNLLGTPWDVSFDNSVLFIEDVSEAPYRIHRLFLQLKLSGKLDNLRGLVFGRFANCEADCGPQMEEVFEMIVEDFLKDFSYPVVCTDSFGHFGKNIPLPIGAKVKLSETNIELIESPFS